MNLYIDIETLPTDRQDVINEVTKDISAPGSYKKQESIDKWIAENYEIEEKKQIAKTSLSGTFGQILAIGFAIDDEEIQCLYRDDDKVTEELLLDYFFNIIATELGDRPHQQIKWIGHNIGGFDLRYIHQRAIVNGVKPSIKIPYDDRPYSGTYFDTMYEWAGFGNRISQDNLCRALGLDTKDGMTGADVWDYWKAGKHEEIREYCKADVKAVRDIYKRLTFGE